MTPVMVCMSPEDARTQRDKLVGKAIHRQDDSVSYSVIDDVELYSDELG